jgi:nitrate/nitrite-specific signal transduction histidine kinase
LSSLIGAGGEVDGDGRDSGERVSDDGCGFDPDHVQVLADVAHFGLIAMRERVEARLPLTDPTEGLGV